MAWTRDGDGFLSHDAYDVATGAAIESIQDVNTSLLAGAELDAFNLTDWTPTNGGLSLVTTMQVDGLGRTVEQTDPMGNITRVVYNDANHEVRTYRKSMRAKVSDKYL